MLAATEEQQPELTELEQLESLQRMLVEMCERLTDIVEETLDDDGLASRETQLQLEAFEERRDRVLKTLDAEQYGPLPVKIGKLEKLVEALECSWVYFNGLIAPTHLSENASDWHQTVE